MLEVKAYLHPTHDGCVTTDPSAYVNPRELVLATDAQRALDVAHAEIEALKAALSGAPAAKRKKAAISQTPGFDMFWAAWPQHHRKVNKKGCLTRWVAASLEPRAQEVVQHVEAMKLSRDWTKDGGAFIPAPLVYLNQERYEAPAPAATSAPGSLSGITYTNKGIDGDGFLF